MKKINAIVKGKASLLPDLLNRKASRILRNVDSAIAAAEDGMDAATAQMEKFVLQLGDVTGGDDTEKCGDVLNAYVMAAKTHRAWKESRDILAALKKELNSEVEIPEEN